MLKKQVAIVIIAVLFSLGLGVRLMHAEKYYGQQAEIDSDAVTLIEEKLDKISSSILKEGDKDKEILDKLSQVLQNQAQIKDELRIIKIRATRR
ncbi:hypothetical protein ACFL4C_00050 [Candidatus Omnitrophota bacterium]